MEESPVMCAKGCGFFGNSAFRGMCSKCFKASFKEEAKNVAEKATKKKQTLEQRTPDKDSASQDVKELTSTFTEMLQSGLADDKTRKESRLQAPDVDDGDSMKEGAAAGPGPAKHGCEARVSEVPTGAVSAQKEGEKKRKRCVSCRKKVGLTGFTCRCGGLFCGLHRYSDVHQCPFDYKKLAQEELRKANPLIAAAKVDKL